MSHDWIDISMALREDVVTWPGDPRFERRVVSRFSTDGVRVSQISASVHTGTHVDAPAHYLADGEAIDASSIDALVGPCVVTEVADDVRRIQPVHLQTARLAEAERLLIKTSNSRRHLLQSTEFHSDYAHLTPQAAAFLARRRIRCVGIDYLSIGGMKDGDETHRALLSSGVLIIEGLDLRRVVPGDYELVCLPLKLVDAEGAPARAILRKLDETETDPRFIEDAVEYATKTG